MKSESEGSRSRALVVGALGVVYGDIGTSPIYAFRECFDASHGLVPNTQSIMGILSLIIWSLIIIVTGKYLANVMRMNNQGEGGILSLLSLAFPETLRGRKKEVGLALGVFGAALLYGDGMITPAISVLSAVEGLELAAPSLHHYILPITIGILIGIFSFQQVGTSKVGRVFGPVMVVWFTTLATLGILQLRHHPEILGAFNPLHALDFFSNYGWTAFVVMGSIFLVLTGAESLYADMGHFGIKPIRRAWFFLVLPALILNYLGQGSLLLSDPLSSKNPFFQLAPSWALLPLVVLSTAAAVIASQALISGAYSLTMQAIQLGYLPRMAIRHTSSTERGQIYMPSVNWGLLLACICLVWGFKTSKNLSAAYGIAVALTMLVTTVMFYYASQRVWGWARWQAGLLCGVFFAIESVYFSSNLLKVLQGGWFPLVVAAAIFTMMTTWKTGRKLVWRSMRAGTLPLELFVKDLGKKTMIRVKGTAVFLSGNPDGTPLAMLHNLKHNKVLHEDIVTLTLKTASTPYVESVGRVEVQELGHRFFRVIAHYGFMEEPNVMEVMEVCKTKGLEFNLQNTTFFLSRETIIPTARPGMALWRDRLFSIMSQNAQRATAYFHLPPNRVVEMGMQVEV